MILKDTKQLIGSVGIIPDPKRENPQVRMLGYWLDESYWGKGYMTEAVQGVLNYGFEELRLSLITATCYPHNKRSQKVLKKNGFIYEGTLHQAELITTQTSTTTNATTCPASPNLLRKTMMKSSMYGKCLFATLMIS